MGCGSLPGGDVCEPLVLDLISHVVTAAGHHGAWVGVRGETASDPEVAAAQEARLAPTAADARAVLATLA